MAGAEDESASALFNSGETAVHEKFRHKMRMQKFLLELELEHYDQAVDKMLTDPSCRTPELQARWSKFAEMLDMSVEQYGRVELCQLRVQKIEELAQIVEVLGDGAPDPEGPSAA